MSARAIAAAAGGNSAEAGPAPSAARGEIVALTYLRWYASFSVLVFHVGEQVSRLNPGFARLFALRAGVDVFFAISGFVMVHATGAASPDGPRVGARTFLLRRLERIVPLYWLATLALASAVALVPALAHSGRVQPLHLLGSLLFVPLRHPVIGARMPLLVPGWTLNYEMAFYAVFAAALALGGRGTPGRGRSALLLAMAPLSLLALAGAIWPSETLAGFYASPLLGEFVAGMALALIPLAWRRLPATAGLALAAGLIVVLALPRADAMTMSVARHVLVIGVPAAALVGLGVIIPLPRIALLCLLGDASYALYLSQALTVPVIAAVLARGGIGTVGGGWLLLVVGSLVGLGCGVACHWWVERPLSRAVRAMITAGSPAARKHRA